MYREDDQKREIAFVHIGKTGGTSVSLMIRRRCFTSDEAGCKEEEFLKRKIKNESEISKQVKEYYHGRRPDVSKYPSFIVTVRDPIDRIVSAYLFEHLTHVKARCYKTVDDFVTIGLKLPESIDGNFTLCQWLAFQSTRGACDCPRGNKNGLSMTQYHQILHSFANYHYYVGELLQHDEKEIFVLRTEELSEDWWHLNKLLGGRDERPHNVEKVTHRSADKVQNRTMSSEGVQNLCHVLCEEIQLYKKLIIRAKNLDESAKYNSLRRLGSRCPYEVSVENCPPLPAEIFSAY